MNDSLYKSIIEDKRGILLIVIVSFLLISFYQIVIAQINPDGKTDQETLDEILKETGEYCARLRHAAFYFVCIEEISETIDHSKDIVQNIMAKPSEWPSHPRFRIRTPRIKEENKYFYDYQIIRKANKIKESRILLEKNGKKKYKKNAQLETFMFSYKNVLYGAIDLLDENRQSYYNYKLIGEEILNGEKVVVIKSTPKSYLREKELLVKKGDFIWIKENCHSILRVKWNQDIIGDFQVIKEVAERYKAEPQLTLNTEYGIEKNGIRFPSKFSVEEAYISQKGKKFVRSKTKVVYKDYKFFTVETDIKY